MTRHQLKTLINDAHEALHLGEVESAHDILHGGIGETESMTTDPEVQQAVAALMEAAKGKLPCGHTIGDLIGGYGAVTKCGACVAERQPKTFKVSTVL